MWWPSRTTPWVYSGKEVGGIQFMNYIRSRDFYTLKDNFKNMIEKYKPEILVVLFDWKDINPDNFVGGYRHPEGLNNIENIVDQNYDLSYFEDLLLLANTNDIKVIMWPQFSAYGGVFSYPFTYYSRTGWFWKRPDWNTAGGCINNNKITGRGCAWPSSDAMRHPPLSKLDPIKALVKPNHGFYEWIEHEAAYVNVVDPQVAENEIINLPYKDRLSWHSSLTSNGVEDTGVGVIKVDEFKDMVFNGFDTAYHSIDPNKPNLHMHTPIPSFSSTAYRDLVKHVMKKIALKFKGKGVYAYYLFQEPTYAVLRENMRSCQFGDVNIGSYDGNPSTTAGNNCMYDVDYSQAELNRYNYWRQNIKHISSVTQIPFPLDPIYSVPADPDANNYKLFRNWNLASFLLNIKDGIKEADPSAKISVPLYVPYENGEFDDLNTYMISDDKFVGEWMDGTGVGPKEILTQVKPDIVILEPPSGAVTILHNIRLREQLSNIIKKYSTAKEILTFYTVNNNSFLWPVNNTTPQDSIIKEYFINQGFSNVYFPIFNDNIDKSGYSSWVGSNNCQNCLTRYPNINMGSPYFLFMDQDTNLILNNNDFYIISNLLFNYKHNPVIPISIRLNVYYDSRFNLLDVISALKYKQ